MRYEPWCWRDDWHVDGESAFSLLAKFQRLNALSCKALTESFVCREGRKTIPADLDLRDARRFDLPRMMEALRLPLVDVAAAFVMPSGAIQRIAFPTLRWCVRCAREGVHLTEFQYRRLDVCPVHGTSLLERCERCGETFPYRLRADLFRSPFSCPSCTYLWWEPAQGVDDLRIHHRYRRRLDRKVPGFAPAIDTQPGFAGVAPGDERAGAAYLLGEPESKWISFGAGDVAEASGPSFEVPELHGFDLDAQARSCYKAVRRRIMKMWGRRHRACIMTAARHLTWPLTACTTAPFCPVAVAFLRWRCKWEGISIPRSLLQRPLHGALGLALWLSLDAPVAPQNWSRPASQWLTLHALVGACLDSFHWYRAEAYERSDLQRTLWLPFPVHDFLQRTVVVRGGVEYRNPPQLCALAIREFRNKVRASSAAGNAGHRDIHTLKLSFNLPPNSLTQGRPAAASTKSEG
nr:TniQ family protein [Paraburkholderia sp. Ac-20347]